MRNAITICLLLLASNAAYARCIVEGKTAQDRKTAKFLCEISDGGDMGILKVIVDKTNLILNFDTPEANDLRRSPDTSEDIAYSLWTIMKNRTGESSAWIEAYNGRKKIFEAKTTLTGQFKYKHLAR